MNFVQNAIADIVGDDIAKEILEWGIDTIKQELLTAKKEIETDTTLNEFEKRIKLHFLNSKKKIAERTLDITFEPGEREGKEQEEVTVTEEVTSPEEETVVASEEDKITEEETITETEVIESQELTKLNKEEQFIYNQIRKQWIQDPNQIAYILATVKGESGYKNIKEIGWEKKKYGKEWYYGRWYVQLTHKTNYEKFNKIIKKSWKTFKDNQWNVLKNIDIVKNPDIILQSNELSAFILIYGMKYGSFTNKKLADFINKNTTDFYNARSIINGMSSAPKKYAQFAQEYKKKIDTNIV
jgi:hypothetical protein